LFSIVVGKMKNILFSQLQKFVNWCHRNQRWRSHNQVLDAALVVLAALAVGIAMASSMLQAVGLL
jgi:hypothetical protein